jgi:hypothetical protein
MFLFKPRPAPRVRGQMKKISMRDGRALINIIARSMRRV